MELSILSAGDDTEISRALHPSCNKNHPLVEHWGMQGPLHMGMGCHVPSYSKISTDGIFTPRGVLAEGPHLGH